MILSVMEGPGSFPNNIVDIVGAIACQRTTTLYVIVLWVDNMCQCVIAAIRPASWTESHCQASLCRIVGHMSRCQCQRDEQNERGAEWKRDRMRRAEWQRDRMRDGQNGRHGMRDKPMRDGQNARETE